MNHTTACHYRSPVCHFSDGFFIFSYRLDSVRQSFRVPAQIALDTAASSHQKGLSSLFASLSSNRPDSDFIASIPFAFSLPFSLLSFLASNPSSKRSLRPLINNGNHGGRRINAGAKHLPPSSDVLASLDSLRSSCLRQCASSASLQPFLRFERAYVKAFHLRSAPPSLLENFSKDLYTILDHEKK